MWRLTLLGTCSGVRSVLLRRGVIFRGMRYVRWWRRLVMARRHWVLLWMARCDWSCGVVGGRVVIGLCACVLLCCLVILAVAVGDWAAVVEVAGGDGDGGVWGAL